MRNYNCYLLAGIRTYFFLFSLIVSLLSGCSVLWPAKVPPPGAIQMEGVNQSPARQQYFEQLAMPVTTANN